MLRCKVRRCFCQEGALHLEFAVLPLQFAKPGALGKGERGFSLAAMLFLVIPDPVAERRVVYPVFTRYVSNCPRCVDHHLGDLFTEFRRVFPVSLCHVPPVLSAGDPKGSAVRKGRGTSLQVTVPEWRLAISWHR